MFQIDNSTAVAAIPAPTPAGSAGYFTDGNPATGVSATILPAEFMNMLMMENMNVLAAAGIAPVKGKYDQLALAISKIIGSNLVWASIGNKPTTISGYGITDAYTKSQVDTSLAAKANKATTVAGYGITDAMPTAGGAYSPSFSSVRVFDSSNIGNPGSHVSYGTDGALTNCFNSVCNKANGTGGFSWRTVNADNSVTGPTMSYSSDGVLTVPTSFSVPAITSNTTAPTQGAGYAGQFLANCAFVATAVATAVAGKADRDSISAVGLASNNPAQPYMRQASTSDLVILSRAMDALGNAQTWQNVTSSRAFSTTYTNSTGRPIMIAIGGLYGAGIYDYVTASINGGAAIPFCAGASTSGQTRVGGTLIIPTGATYNLVSNIPMTSWWELR